MISMKTCSICRRKDRVKIDRALLQNERNEDISKSFGVRSQVLIRHRSHIAALIVRHEKHLSGDLVEQMIQLNQRLEQPYQEAHQTGDFDRMGPVIKEQRATLLGQSEL